VRKWLNWVALVVVFSIACGFLASWQFSRRETRLASIELVEENYSQPPTSLAQVLGSQGFAVPEASWRSVSLRGEYLSDLSLLVRNRPNNGQPGFEQIIPFQTHDGRVVFISRGWLPTGSRQDSPDFVPKAPSGDLEIVGRLIASEPKFDRGAPTGQIASINVDLANQITKLNAIPNGYLRLVSESSKVPTGLKPMPTPSIDEGNNLSYALQWMLFAVMAVLALVWRIRRDRQLASGTKSTLGKKSRAKLDEELEDSVTRAK
jgi:cytochrome oxidase assembly protein ShyY1